ncbi:MAG TPA: transposase, partial [Candidatus Eremiobacteraeota bacterium]|nr:transposase [Candidatus Eremiobacteraeota bacterium]
TELYKYKEPHCSHCLRRRHKGIVEYYHRVLEVKLIMSNGIVISTGTEFIENPGENVDKQDWV